MGKTFVSGGAVMTALLGGTPLGTLAVGSTLKLNVNGMAKEFLVVHQGRPSTLYDSSCDGVWLLMKDVYTTMEWLPFGSSVNKYALSNLHTYLNDTFIGLLDSDIQAVIKEVKIPYVNGDGSSGSVASGSGGLSTKAFLLAAVEVGHNGSTTVQPADGALLDYFIYGGDMDGASDACKQRVAYLDGTAKTWWLRSPYMTNTLKGYYVSALGVVGSGSVESVYGIRPALILPSTVLVDTDGTIKI